MPDPRHQDFDRGRCPQFVRHRYWWQDPAHHPEGFRKTENILHCCDRLLFGINEIGNGFWGITYKVEYNNQLYALKKQKVLNRNIKSLEELKFYKWINKLKKSDRVFFMPLYKYNIIDDCKLDINRITTNKETHKMDKSKYCIEFLLDLKDGNITELNLNNQQTKF